jgi:hormone-sensitive lipase
MEKRDEDEEKQPEGFHVWEALKSIIENNIEYYKSDDSINGLKIHGALLGIIDHLDEARQHYRDVESFCKLYDFDENTKGNGYRSFLKILNMAINHIFKTLKYVTENRSGLLFRKNAYTK